MTDPQTGQSGLETAAKRLLALAALVATVAVIATLVSGWQDDADTAAPAAREQVTTTVDKEGAETPREYAIESGDTLLAIAERHGISVKRIERLNPKVDTNTLTTGDILILR